MALEEDECDMVLHVKHEACELCARVQDGEECQMCVFCGRYSGRCCRSICALGFPYEVSEDCDMRARLCHDCIDEHLERYDSNMVVASIGM